MDASVSKDRKGTGKFMSKISKDAATEQLLASFARARSRRSLLRGVIATTGGLVAGAGALSVLPAYAKVTGMGSLSGTGVVATGTGTGSKFKFNKPAVDSVATILTVARTAEQLAVTFYTNGIANASQLGISGDSLDSLKAILVEEQIHQQFFTANGGSSLAETFSFPHGAQTFTDLNTFIATQQQLEGVFDSAFLAAVLEFAQMGRPDLAQVAAQIAMIEEGHRVIGRQIGSMSPAEEDAYAPALIATVGDAPALVQKAGYLSPTSGNSYTYQEVSTSDSEVKYTKPFSVASSTVGNG